MKTKFWVLTIAVLSLIFSSAITFAEIFPEKGGIQLNPGENEILIPEDVSPFYVKDLVFAYPEILTVTYFEFEEEKGYANVLGGVGEDFIIYPNHRYNITLEEKLEVILK